MKFKRMYAENAYSFQRLEFDFLDYSGSTTIILGKNIDQKSANGAGKTSLIKTLYWGLWNKDLNGALLSSVVRRDSTNGALVIIEFEDRGNEYRITRYLDYVPRHDSPKLSDKTPITGSGVEFLINGQPFNGDTHPQTQKIIEQKVRMTPRLFLSAVLMAQDTREHFLTANDTNKKDILSEMLDLKVYDDAFKKIKEAITEIEGKVNNSEAKIETLNEQIASNLENIKGLELEEAKYKQESDSKLEKLDFEISQIRKQLDDLKKISNEVDDSIEIKKDLELVDSKIKNLKKEIEVEAEAKAALTSFELEVKSLTDKIDNNNQVSLDKKGQKLSLEQELKNSQEHFDEESIASLDAKVKRNDSKLIALKSQVSNILRVDTQIVNVQDLILILNKEKEKVEHQIEEAKNNSLCPTCLRTFDIGENNTLDNIVKELSKELTKSKEKIEKANKDLETLSAEKLTLGLVKEELKKVEDEQSLDKNQLALLQEKKNKYQVALQKRDMINAQIMMIEKELLRIQEDSEKSLKQKALLSTKIQKLQTLIQEIQPYKIQLIDLENSVADKRAALAQAEIKGLKIQQAKTAYKEKVEQGNKLLAEKKELMAKANPYSTMLKRVKEQAAAHQAQLDKLKTVVLELQEELKYLNFWKNGFSPSGIRSFITDDVIDLLNKKTQENLQDLFDGAITVLFDPESKNNKGQTSNKISTTFLLNGKETQFESLSGGEKQRAVLATELALTEVAEARAGTKLNIRFLDEPFTGIDDNGQIKSLVLFSRLAREKDGFFIISHEEKFQTLCQKAVYVVKHKEVSRLVDKHMFDNINIASDEVDDSFDLEAELREAPKKMKKNLLEEMSKKRKKQNEED